MDRDLFSPDNSEQVAKMHDLMPFGLGSPVCVGQQFGMVVKSVANATVVKILISLPQLKSY
jgi:cytochrome P450